MTFDELIQKTKGWITAWFILYIVIGSVIYSTDPVDRRIRTTFPVYKTDEVFWKAATEELQKRNMNSPYQLKVIK